jgi:tetratricopeptide (TPR) repeat protein
MKNTRRKYYVIVFILLGILVYSNTFLASFHFDDELFIIENYALRNIWNLKGIWDSFPSRFVTLFTFALNYHSNKLNVFGYHVVNLLIHLGSAILVWWLTKLIFVTPVMKKSKLSQSSDLIAIFVSLIFLTHPIQTESVTYIWQRCTSLAGFLYLFSLCLYLKSRLLQINKELTSQGLFLYISSLTLGLAAMFTKENSVTLPLMIILCEFCFFKAGRHIQWKKALPFLIMLPVIPILLFSTKPITFSDMQHFLNMPDARKYYLLTQLRVWITYIRLLFVPINQNLDYDYPVNESFMNLPTLGSFLLLAAIIIIAILLYRRYRLLSFGIFWFFLILSPDSSIIPLKDVIFEHRLYLPIVGFGFFIIGAIYQFFPGKTVKFMNVVLSLSVISCSIMTYQRNKVWNDEFSLWSDIMRKSPQKIRSYNNRGNAFLNQGNLDEAISDYNRTIEINPNSALAYNGRGDVYLYQGNLDEAISDYSQAIAIDPQFTEAYYNRGTAYMKQGSLEEAVEDFNKALEVNPNYAKAYYNRGTLYLRQGNLNQAMSDYNRAIEIDPAYAQAYNNRGTIYLNQGNNERAMSDFNNAIKANPNYAEVYNNRGNIYMAEGKLERAIADFNKALEMNPNYANVYCNRGLAYENQGNLQRAILDYSRAIEINPDFAQAYYMRATAYFKKQDYGDSQRDVDRAQTLGYKIDPDFVKELKEASK